MEKQIATFKDYAIFMADKTSLLEIAQFVVKENYSHHLSSFTEKEVNEDIKSVLEEEEYLYDNKSHIYIARDAFGNIIGCIRSFRCQVIYGFPYLTCAKSQALHYFQ